MEQWTVNFHDEFLPEFRELEQAVREELAANLIILRERGPKLGRPTVDTLDGSKHANMKEIRFKAADGVWRFAFAFDPDRKGIVLCGGDKSGVGQKRFYKALTKLADKRFDAHLEKEKAK